MLPAKLITRNGDWPATAATVNGQESVMKKCSKRSLASFGSVNFFQLEFGKTPWVTYAETFVAPLAFNKRMHSIKVPPDWTRSSTMTTCLFTGSPSLRVTIRLSPSRTLDMFKSFNRNVYTCCVCYMFSCIRV